MKHRMPHIENGIFVLLALSAFCGTAEARRFRMGVVPVPHSSGPRTEPRNDESQPLEEPHASVTLDENGKPVQSDGVPWLSILLVLGGAGLSIMMVRMALKPSD